MSNGPCTDKPWAMDFDESKTHGSSRTRCISVAQNNKKCMISRCLKFKCTNNIVEYEALMLSLQRTISLNAVARKVILHPMNSVDAFKDITINEGKHEKPLKTPAKGKKGNPTLKGVISLNKLNDSQKFYRGQRNRRTHRTTTTNE